VLRLGFRVEHGFCCCSGSGRFLFSLRTPHGHIFATRNTLRFVSAARDRDGDGNLDFGVKRQRHLVLSDRLDWRIEHDLRTADLGTIVSGAFGYTLSGRLSLQRPGWEVISWQVAMFMPLAAIAVIALWPHGLHDVPLPVWLGLGYVSFVSQYLAFFVFNAAMAMGGVARVGQLMLLQPFVIVALAAPVNGEPIKFSTLAYAAAVVATVIVGQRMSVRRK